MIDWMTLRYSLEQLPDSIRQRVMDNLGLICCFSPDGDAKWTKRVLDTDSLRSDTPGLCWLVTGDDQGRHMLTLGASPASIRHGCNVFGSDDPMECANELIRFASRAFSALLPRSEKWQCRRIDVTENYALASLKEVRQFLRQLMTADASRQKVSQAGGDSVYWNRGSDLRKGKAYAKGPQLRFLMKKSDVAINDWQLDQADRLARLELTLGSRWFRRLEESGKNWTELTADDLRAQHAEYFGKFIGKAEVVDMGTLLSELEKVAPTPGYALAAHRTWALIKTIGYEQTKASIPRATWSKHLRILRAAGLSDADIGAGNILPFRRTEICILNPVRSWDDLRRAC